MNKSYALGTALTANDNELLNRFINLEVPQSYFLEKYDVTRQYFNVVVTAIDKDAFIKRQDIYSERLERFSDMCKEGIPFEVILQDEDMQHFFTDTSLDNIKKARESAVRRFRNYGLMEDTKSVMLEQKVRAYVSTLQIERELERYLKEQHMLLTKIADKYDASYQKVHGIKERIELYGSGLPKLPDDLITLLWRNIDMVLDKRGGMTYDEIAEKYGVERSYIGKIIKSYDPYVVK